MAKTYKIRKFQNGKNKAGDPFLNYSITIPASVAEVLPENMTFACELTEDGIVFSPAQAEREPVNLPTWAQTNGSASEGEVEADAEATDEPKRSRKRPSRATA